jgi:serine/threonine-protein kinase
VGQETSRQTPLGRAGGYDLLVEIASGGMATVYVARAARKGNDAPLVAIKRPHKHLVKEKVYLTMLLDEARLASSISHSNVVKVRELGFDGGEPFIVMDYVEGASLAELRRELLDRGRTLEPKVAVRIILDALGGLHAAHTLKDDTGNSLGLVHRDVSPHNILVGCDGKSKLTDFGIAKAEDRLQSTRTHEIKGKLAYLAPERVDKRKQCTSQSDIFSMAVVLWECIAGRRLFRGEEPIETLQEVLTAPIPKLQSIGMNISQELDDTIAGGLERDLDMRFETAELFAQALERAAGEAGIATHEEVSRVMETIFGAKMRVLHADIRKLVDAEFDKVIEVSGLHPRPAPDPAEEGAQIRRRQFDSLAPKVPTGRYTFGARVIADKLGLSQGVDRKWIAAGAGAAILVVGIIAFATSALFGKKPVQAAQPVAADSAITVMPRRVAISLPFLAVRVIVDDTEKTLSPASDIAAIDLPGTSGERHHVRAFAVDGTTADGWVREVDGVGRPENGGLTVHDANAAAADTSQAAQTIDTPTTTLVSPRGKPAGAGGGGGAQHKGGAHPSGSGTVRDGFTKLK